MLFAIVFGLSMDYEVFLVSRMHERWTQTRDRLAAPSREGLALTGARGHGRRRDHGLRVPLLRARRKRVIKEFGLSLASAVFLDALVVRCLLLPATLSLHRRARRGGCRRGSRACCRS